MQMVTTKSIGELGYYFKVSLLNRKEISVVRCIKMIVFEKKILGLVFGELR